MKSIKLFSLAFPINVSRISAAIFTASRVGISLLISTGIPARITFLTTSAGTLPLVKAAVSLKFTPCSRAQPITLSSALWRPISSAEKRISSPRSRKQLCVEPVLKCRGVSLEKKVLAIPYTCSGDRFRFPFLYKVLMENPVVRTAG